MQQERTMNQGPRTWGELIAWLGFMVLWVGFCLALIIGLARFSELYLRHNPEGWPGALVFTFGAPAALSWWAARKLRQRTHLK